MDVISVLLGVPESERDGYRQVIDRTLARDPDTGEMTSDSALGVRQGRDFLVDLLEDRRKRSQEDLISILAVAEFEDVDGETKRLTTDAVVAFVGLLETAGFETTTKLLGNCIVYVARHPDQRTKLWADPTLFPAAIEEVLRYDAPSQFQGRVALRDTTHHGVTIPKNARVALFTGAACRDPREFSAPDRLDITHQPERQIYFEHGHPVCIGKSLARLETQVVLEEVRDQFPNYAVEESGLTRTY